MTFEELALLGVGLYVIFNFGGQRADNGGQRCSTTDMWDGNCISSDGGPCGWFEYLTATSCYKGAPKIDAPQPMAPSSGGGSSVQTCPWWDVFC